MKTMITALVLLTITLLAMTIIIQTRSSPAEATTEDDLEARVASLEDAIDLHLEELRVHEEHILALEALQWTRPERVTQVVAQRLWERATSCRDDDQCYYGDSMLSAFYPLYPYERHDYVTDLTGRGYWTAEHLGGANWLVTAQLGDDASTTFLANSTDHLVCWYELEWCKK
jgi:hypothetical protein